MDFLSKDSGLTNQEVLELMITAVALMDAMDADGASLGSKLWLAYAGTSALYKNVPDVRSAFNMVKEKAQTFVGKRLNFIPNPF